MARSTPAARDPELNGLSVLVVGAGASGIAAARLAASRGARVTVADARPARELGEAVERVRELGATLHAGGHPATLAAAADVVVLSPGVPTTIELVGAARAAGIPVWAEVELAARFCRGRLLGVTGSNGKSTVTSMCGSILRAAGLRGGVGGNLATPFCELLQYDGVDAVHAVELSSFQLETVEQLHADVAVIVNLSPDHLDRHPSYDDYAAAKARLLELQRADDATVLNADDDESRRFDGLARGRLHRFSTRRVVDRGAFVRDGRLVLRTDEGDEELLAVAELPVPGEHNQANALAAALACRLIGCSAQAIAAGLRVYQALPHRLEQIAEIGGVVYYNDSKATNPASTLRALAAFPAGRVQLILGGRDKGADWHELAAEIKQRARRVLLVGEAADAIAAQLDPDTLRLRCATIEAAVDAAADVAAPGDVVLLSPGCASFDQYRNFEERGDDFRRIVGRRRGDRDA